MKEHTHTLGKTDYTGCGRKNDLVTISWSLSEDGRFSASADVWNARKTDILAGGQMVREAADMFPDDKLAQRIAEVWERWHLNDMKAGCEHQRAEGWDKRPIDPSKPTNAYGKHFDGQKQDSWNLLGWLRQDEHPDGLMCRPCPVCGYKYGTAWLKEEIPQEVIDEIKSWSE